MDRRALWCATLLLIALNAAAPGSASAANVLVLPDSFGEGTASLVAALESAGHYVVVADQLEYLWDGTNPSPAGFDVIVHLNGATYKFQLPQMGQEALVDFVRSGGGYVGGQWNGYEVYKGLLLYMDDLVLQLWDQEQLDSDNCKDCMMTWKVVSEQGGHPVLDGIPPTVTFFAGGHDAEDLVEFGVDPSLVLMTSRAGGPAVMVRELEVGKIVAFSSAANYRTELTLQDPNIERLYVNAVAWASGAPAGGPTIAMLADEVEALEDSGALTSWQAGALLRRLDAAQRQIDRGRPRVACSHLRIFIRNVEFLVRRGALTEEEGAGLVALANDIIASLGY